MIGRLLGRELAERLPGSLGFGLVALQRGAKYCVFTMWRPAEILLKCMN